MTSTPSVNLFSGESNWLSSTLVSIKQSQNLAGILGALQGSNDGSIRSFLSSSQSAANALGTISTVNTTNKTQFYAQIAAQTQQKRQQDALEKAMADLQRTQNMVQPTNVLDDYIYFDNGSYIDTKNNIMTMSDGTQIDNTTGLEVFDPASIVDMGNGSFLNTKTNVLTLTDGTKIDTVTGLKVSQLDT